MSGGYPVEAPLLGVELSELDDVVPSEGELDGFDEDGFDDEGGVDDGGVVELGGVVVVGSVDDGGSERVDDGGVVGSGVSDESSGMCDGERIVVVGLPSVPTLITVVVGTASLSPVSAAGE